jgi:hypothetical protein
MKPLEIIGPFPFTNPGGDDVFLYELCENHKAYQDFDTWGYAVNEEAAKELVRRWNLHEELVRLAKAYIQLQQEEGCDRNGELTQKYIDEILG